MKVDLSELKKEFTNHLASLNDLKKTDNNSTNSTNNDEEEKKYELNNNKVSVFSYADELDKFLNDKYKDVIDNSTIKTDDILKLKFENGKFIEYNETDDENKNEKKLPIVGILNDLLNDAKMKCIIDSDNDGKIDEDEVKEFIKSIEDIDGNSDDVSFKDILSGTKKIQEVDISDYTEEEADNSLSGCENGGYSSSASGSSGYSSPGIVSNGIIPASTPSAIVSASSALPETSAINDKSLNIQPNTDGETLEDLEQKKAEKEAELSEAENSYNQVYTGENENVKTAQNDYDNAKAEYENLLAKEESLKEEQKQKLLEVASDVENALSAVNQSEIALNEAQEAVTVQEGNIKQNEASLSELKETLNSITIPETDDEDVKAEAKAKLDEVKAKISEEENKLNEEKAKLEELKAKKEEAQNQLTEKRSELAKAQEYKSNLENEFIINNENIANELKNALDVFNQAGEKVQNTKDSEANKASQAIETVQNELGEINNKIIEKQQEKDLKLN